MRIEATDISVRIGQQTILARMSMAIDGPGMIGLIGPNGAGKSTLLRVLGNLQTPETGIIRYDDVAADDIDRDMLGRRLAYLAQNGPVHWPLAVERVVALGRLPHRRTRSHPEAENPRATEAAMQAVHISHLRSRTATGLSGGERTRMLLARALAVEAELLLADEPIAALDPYHQLEVLELLRSLASGDTTVVVVLHDLSLAMRFCDRLILLSEGRVLADGRPEYVLTDANLEKAYRIAVHRFRLNDEDYIVPGKRLGTQAPDEQIRRDRIQP